MSRFSDKPLQLPKGPKAQSQQLPQKPEKEVQVPPKETEEGDKLTSTLQLSRPFFTKNQIKFAQLKTISNNTTYDQRKNQIFQFMIRICSNLKFPTRVLETSMIYYQRFYLFNSFDTTAYYDTALISLFMAIKNEETIKKLKDLIVVGNQIRSVQMNPDAVETYKRKLLRLEFKLLETISFDFRSYHTEEYVIKFCKKLDISKEISYLSWLITFDSFQTSIGLKVPGHVIAMATIYLSLKIKEDKLNILEHLKQFHCDEDSVFEAVLELLDIYINNYNYTGLVNFYPNLQNKFLEIKLPLSDQTKGLKDTDEKEITNDKYFTEHRDFTNGERRYMLGNQKKRLYNEL